MGKPDPQQLIASTGPAPSLEPLPQGFYARRPEWVAADLLGKWLWRKLPAGYAAGIIVETEAYLSSDDNASHAAKGPNQKNAAMFGPAGHAYVYTIHARQCFNVVTQEPGQGSAVLVRAIVPWVGVELMQQERQAAATRRRSKGSVAVASGANEIALRDLARGPARLCEALGIDRSCDKQSLVPESGLWIESPNQTAMSGEQQASIGLFPLTIGTSPRIGVTQAKELALRFFAKSSPYVSGPQWLSR